MEILIIWIIAAVVAAIVASSKKRSGAGWFICTFICPLLVFVVICLPPATGAMKLCPKCAEAVKAEASVCRYCNHAFDDNDGRAHA